jgi:hypothetical protein
MLRSATRGRRRGRISTSPSFSRITTASRVGVRLVRKRRASSTELRSLPGRRSPFEDLRADHAGDIVDQREALIVLGHDAADDGLETFER